MPRNYAILALLFVAATGCQAVYAGDFVTRASSGYAPSGDEAGARAGHVAAMNESESTPAVRTPDTDADAAPVATARRAGQMGADDSAVHAAVPASAPAADADDKPAPASPHKARALRWQSLLPGVMK